MQVSNMNTLAAKVLSAVEQEWTEEKYIAGFLAIDADSKSVAPERHMAYKWCLIGYVEKIIDRDIHANVDRKTQMKVYAQVYELLYREVLYNTATTWAAVSSYSDNEGWQASITLVHNTLERLRTAL